MKKIFILLSFLLTSNYIHSQTLNEKIYETTCECFNTTENLDRLTSESCYDKSVSQYETEIRELIDEGSEISIQEQAESLGYKIKSESFEYLIFNCEVYFNYMVDVKEKAFVNFKSSITLEKIDSINELILKKRTLELLWERGNYLFVNGELERAEKDYLECLDINPNYYPASFFLGWLNERKGNYDKAIELYENLLDSTDMKAVKINLAIVKQKLKNRSKDN
ncbi:tetratricopeptide repeat protein [Maribacter sp. BPC-D8]|uniref:tetratricopeptide repeat protein n=1 Tax=Maribacter sp. BPC-D8 TaxID=3053613 RepID=UPI002B495E6C|nr:tetratricopeptide repeat protein [Maribacter sp. BPC-D8]WRI31524.1 tetratricopeptide repeat protein [Maribacter sp. BPC-D8]